MDKCENEAILKQNHTIAPLYIFINGKKLKSAERFFVYGNPASAASRSLGLEGGKKAEKLPRTSIIKVTNYFSARLTHNPRFNR